MAYGLVENNVVVSSFPMITNEMHPGAYPGMTVQQLEELNIYLIDESLPSEFNSAIHNVVTNGVRDLTFDAQNKIITGFKTFELKSVDEVYNSKVQQITAARESSIYQNIPHSILNGGSVQLKSQQDMINLNGMMSDALYCKMNNITKSHNFIDANDNIHSLTSDQVIELCTFVKTHIESIYAQNWYSKFVELKAIYENSSLSIEDKLNQIVNYTWN